MAIVYVATVAVPLVDDATARSSAFINALAYPGFAMVAFFIANYIRDLADTADNAKKKIAILEKERSRAIVHNLLEFLRLDRFVMADEETQQTMIDQARFKHKQMRTYVDGVSDAENFEDHIDVILDLHSALSIERHVDIESGVRLSVDALESLGRALDAALSNVGQYATDANVTVSIESQKGYLTMKINDDGPGFDRSAIEPGFGIREILGHHIEEIGGESKISSSLNGGTEISISIPLRS